MSSLTLRPFDPAPWAILFDLDDTLCDYATARRDRLRIAFSLGIEALPGSRNHRVDLDRLIDESLQMHPHGTEHFAELFRRHGIKQRVAADIAANWYVSNRFHGLRLFPDAVETLCAVRQGSALGKRPIGIITNGPTEVQRAKIDTLRLEEFADFVLISEEFGAAKPDPAIFREALRLARVRPEEAAYVGDSPEFDIAGAYAAGIPSIWVNRQGVAWTEGLIHPSREIRSLRELPTLIATGKQRVHNREGGAPEHADSVQPKAGR